MSSTDQSEASLEAVFHAPSVTFEEIVLAQLERAKNTQPAAFKVRAALLDQGRTDTVLAATNDLTVRLKVYASGGENELHAHANEDHVFILLQGQADFFNQDGLMARLGKNEGLMIPRNALYKFFTTSEEPLVMLRIGSPNDAAALHGRINKNGAFAHGDAKENKTVAVKFRPNSFFE